MVSTQVQIPGVFGTNQQLALMKLIIQGNFSLLKIPLILGALPVIDQWIPVTGRGPWIWVWEAYV